MLASPALEGRIAAIKWRPFGRRKAAIVYGTGESITLMVKSSASGKLGETVYLIDNAEDRAYMPSYGARLYLDFDKHGLERRGSYGVWLGGLTRAQQESGDFECLCAMVDDWFTFVEDDVALTLLCVTNGDGHFRIGRDHIALA